MVFLNRIVAALALLYLLLALLLLFFPFVRSSAVGLFSVYSLPLEVNLLLGLVWGSVGVVALLLGVNVLDRALLRRTISRQDQQLRALQAPLDPARPARAGRPAADAANQGGT